MGVYHDFVVRCFFHRIQIVVIHPLSIAQRADVVVVGDRAEPLLLAECKAPGIPVGRQTLAQAVRYNSVLGARYIILTNGLRHYCCECRDGGYVQLDGFPDLSGEPSRP